MAPLLAPYSVRLATLVLDPTASWSSPAAGVTQGMWGVDTENTYVLTHVYGTFFQTDPVDESVPHNLFVTLFPQPPGAGSASTLVLINSSAVGLDDAGSTWEGRITMSSRDYVNVFFNWSAVHPEPVGEGVVILQGYRLSGTIPAPAPDSQIIG